MSGGLIITYSCEFPASKAQVKGLSGRKCAPMFHICSTLWSPLQSSAMIPGTSYALTIVGASIGEWNYWILGSAVEVALLGAIVYYAWTWPKGDYSAPARQT